MFVLFVFITSVDIGGNVQFLNLVKISIKEQRNNLFGIWIIKSHCGLPLSYSLKLSKIYHDHQHKKSFFLVFCSYIIIYKDTCFSHKLNNRNIYLIIIKHFSLKIWSTMSSYLYLFSFYEPHGSHNISLYKLL